MVRKNDPAKNMETTASETKRTEQMFHFQHSVNVRRVRKWKKPVVGEARDTHFGAISLSPVDIRYRLGRPSAHLITEF